MKIGDFRLLDEVEFHFKAATPDPPELKTSELKLIASESESQSEVIEGNIADLDHHNEDNLNMDISRNKLRNEDNLTPVTLMGMNFTSEQPTTHFDTKIDSFTSPVSPQKSLFVRAKNNGLNQSRSLNIDDINTEDDFGNTRNGTKQN
jgi:hypothetical protein